MTINPTTLVYVLLIFGLLLWRFAKNVSMVDLILLKTLIIKEITCQMICIVVVITVIGVNWMEGLWRKY